jgi:hypothetical protein
VAEQNRLTMIISQASVAKELSRVFSSEENLEATKLNKMESLKQL